MQLASAIWETFATRFEDNERGAVGWLAVGVVLGVLLVIGGIIKFLIPGE
ncbi:MAG TPA: hypothetical protein VNC78_01485 [Actinomycetota bacterium]|nr:hypothetical protein [Actinomycetota bacterium]